MAEPYPYIDKLASCSCGACQIRVKGKPIRISICHCQACQRRSGSIMAVQARFAMADLTLLGSLQRYVRQAESGNPVWFYFCPNCAATLYYQFPDQAEFASIPVGAFADASFPIPQFSVYNENKHVWLNLPECIAAE